MFAICVESSHIRGMGHLFRAINLINELNARGLCSIIYINNNEKSIKIIEQRGISYRVVDLNNFHSRWEKEVITKDCIKVWINDRLDTRISHVKKLKDNSVKVISFDDFGDGSKEVDLNIVGLYFTDPSKVNGLNKCIGVRYLILDSDIDLYKKKRNRIETILVTLGGSDTHGVTVNVINQLKKLDIRATILLGPSFNHYDALEKVIDTSFKVIKNVPSLAKEFANYDLAITGGGITAFEAAASGLPVLMIANEIFEIPICETLQNLGIGIYIGKYDKFQITNSHFRIPVERMSRKGMELISPFGAVHVVDEILRVTQYV